MISLYMMLFGRYVKMADIDLLAGSTNTYCALSAHSHRKMITYYGSCRE